MSHFCISEQGSEGTEGITYQHACVTSIPQDLQLSKGV